MSTRPPHLQLAHDDGRVRLIWPSGRALAQLWVLLEALRRVVADELQHLHRALDDAACLIDATMHCVNSTE